MSTTVNHIDSSLFYRTCFESRSHHQPLEDIHGNRILCGPSGFFFKEISFGLMYLNGDETRKVCQYESCIKNAAKKILHDGKEYVVCEEHAFSKQFYILSKL